jgi:outer membrane protein assembly factor BamA
MPYQTSVFLCMLTLAACLPHAQAQQYRTKNIQFKGDDEYSEAEMLAATGLKTGVMLTPAEMDERSQQLMLSGVFANVAYTFNNQDLVFQLLPASHLYPIHLENLPLNGGAELDAKLHARFPLYHGKVPSQGSLLDSVRGELESELTGMGIPATVATSPYSADGTTKTTAIDFSITTPQVKVGEIRLDGNSPSLAAQALVPTKKLTGQNYSTDKSAQEVEDRVREYYHGLGYLEADVHAVADPKPVVNEAGVQIPFGVRIAEGTAFKLATVRLEPGLLVTQEEYDKGASLHPGELADRRQLERGWELIRNRYKAKGYLLVAVKPEPTFDRANGTVSFRVTVEPGDVYHMNTVKFQNVSDDLRRMLLHNWQMAPDDLFDENYVRDFPSIAAKQEPALGRILTGISYVWHLSVDPQTHMVDVVIALAKRN